MQTSTSLEILNNVGVVFHSEAARQLFKKHGAKVDGEIVYINKKMVDDAVQSSPHTYEHGARNPKNDILVGHRQKKHVISGIYGSVYVLDPDKGRRLGTMADYINFIKLFQATDMVTVVGGLQVEPSDADPHKKFFQMLHQVIRHTDKPVWGFPGYREDLENMFKMVAMSMGHPDKPLERTLVGTAVCPLSPLRFTEEHGDTIMTYAKYNQVTYLNSCIMAGASGPFSLLGTATLSNTEILAGLVLCQLTRPGAPMVYVPGATVADLKRGQYTGGGPESNLIVIAGLQMALDMYKLPTRAMGGLSDAKSVDFQAGAETMQNVLMLLLSGLHFMSGTLGNMDGQLTASFEKYILDVELIDRALRILKGIEGYNENLATDIIREIAHKGDFITHKSTFENFRLRWRPMISNWEDYQRWQRGGAEGLLPKARSMSQKMIAGQPECMIEPDLDRDLAKFVNDVQPVKKG
ncbi:MAG: trimethylamine methyltransferase family protein [Deltaproteobacteria bacterium]|nr:trimethylamine methyltransferase family protein [Deltaproteobacteria bacterium]